MAIVPWAQEQRLTRPRECRSTRLRLPMPRSAARPFRHFPVAPLNSAARLPEPQGRPYRLSQR